MFNKYTILLILIVITYVLSKPPSDVHPHLKGLSDIEHNVNTDQHDTRYDHEAFLGKEQAEEFEQLTPEESKRRLKKIIDRIDTDHNGVITKPELKYWIKTISQRYIIKDRDRRWFELFKDDHSPVNWTHYSSRTFGDELEARRSPEEVSQLRQIISSDKRRWQAADLNKDSFLDREEFLAFIHPQDFKHMKDAYAAETLDGIDKNGDGYVDVNEFLKQWWDPDISKPNEQPPDYLSQERKRFSGDYDTNNDGKMDLNEIREWVSPSEYDPVQSETEHLVFHADTNKDESLSAEEILNNYSLFVGSQATNYGDALKNHEEL